MFCRPSTAPVGGKGRFWCVALRHNAYVRIILSDFVRFWCIFCMVSFRQRVRIAGDRFGVLHATQLIGHAARLLYVS